MKLQVPIREGLFEERDGKATLLGSRCTSCGQVFFPPRTICSECLATDLEQAPLGGTGSLYSYSIVNIPAEHYPAPYAVGWILLPGGIRVFSQIRNWEGRRLKIGMAMALLIGKLWEEQDREIIGYSFRPEEEHYNEPGRR